MPTYTPRPFVRQSYEPNLRFGDMLRRRGDVIAQGELQRGDASAQLWSNLGQTIAGTVGTIMQERENAPIREMRQMQLENAQLENQARKGEAHAAGVSSAIQGDALKKGDDGVWTYDRDFLTQQFQANGLSDRLPGVFEGLDAFDKSARSVVEAKREGLAGLAYGVTQLGNTPAAFNQAIELALKNGFITRQEVGPLIQRVGDDPAKIGEVVSMIAAQSQTFAAKLAPKTPNLHNVPAGSTVIDQNNLAAGAVFTAPSAEPKGPAVGSFEDFIVRQYGANPTPEQITAGRKVYQQADDRPIIVRGPGGLTQNAESQVINRLSNQWTETNKTAVALDQQVRIMDAGLAAARAGDLAQGGQTVLVTFQKILDPNSVVRESEFDRSREGQALMDRARGAFERLTKGGPGVPIAELEKYAALAKQIASAQRNSRTGAIKERLGKNADRYNIPRELIFEAEGGAPVVAPAAAATSGGSGDADPLGLFK
jgi:hypothetical protein